MTWQGESLLLHYKEKNTTINRMEILGVLSGLEMLHRPCIVEIYSDSQYTVKSIKYWIDGWSRQGWRTATGAPVKNADLMKRLLVQMKFHKINAFWVKGHNGDWRNELCNDVAQSLTAYKK